MTEQHTNGLDAHGQVWLAGIQPPCFHRVADVCAQKLARMFCEKCPSSDIGSLSVELDNLSLACLLLAAEWGGRSPAATADDLAPCLEKVSKRFWGDVLPWQLALALFRKDEHAAASRLRELTMNLDHHNSAIRMWMFDLAWCVRGRLNLMDAHVRLMRNVADKLAYWDCSLGLCRSLFSTDELFWQMADSFEAPGFEEQYRTVSHLRARRVWPSFRAGLNGRSFVCAG